MIRRKRRGRRPKAIQSRTFLEMGKLAESILYFDIVGGISGDMTVAALMELGVSLERLRDGVAAVGLQGVTLSAGQEQRHHLSGTRFQVHAGAEMEGGEDEGGGDHRHGNDPHGTPRQPAHPHEHNHRAYRDIRAMIEDGGLTPGARERALEVFARLAEAEGAIHAMPTEEVTFHEVGAWDSIADIVCTAVALDFLAPRAVLCSPVPLGSGSVHTAHGAMPVPAPATLRLLQGFPVVQGGPAYERTTPTGAAILAALASPAPDPLFYTPQRIGIGIGSKDSPEVPNILRAVWGEREGNGSVPNDTAGTTRDTVECAEANLDDANPEWIGYLMERLLDAGALDVSLIPVQMKKNRPGTLVQVLYAPELRGKLMGILLSESTTLGVRYRLSDRVVLPREKVTVMTPWGEVGGVAAEFGGSRRFSPEFEDCRQVALGNGVPLREVYQAAQMAWLDKNRRQ